MQESINCNSTHFSQLCLKSRGFPDSTSQLHEGLPDSTLSGFYALMIRGIIRHADW